MDKKKLELAFKEFCEEALQNITEKRKKIFVYLQKGF